uniref:Uncharacterized protein n=2 Tax=Avena sativa TaxID=4498 RepID=A0ACD5WZ37_AVESA
MDRERMKMAILEQEHTFRQQVHEMHRVYHVQKQLMREAQQTAGLSRGHAETKPKLDVWRNEKPNDCQKFYGFSETRTPASAEECNLDLTLATGSSNMSSSSRSQKGKQAMKSSDSDSGTAVSSTSTESELAQFKELDTSAAARFQNEIKRFTIADEKNQPPWPTQHVGLRMTW